jgi:hypothetical protein
MALPPQAVRLFGVGVGTLAVFPTGHMFSCIAQKGLDKKLSGWTNQKPNWDKFCQKGPKRDFETTLLSLLFPYE